MRDRKPIPKNQAQIVQDTITPFLNQGKPVSQNVFTHRDNRALNTTRKTDNVKNISIGLEDIDYALKYYFENIIKPTVVQDGNRIAVQIMYGSPERWQSVQADGYYRDTNGKAVLPLIMFKRTNIEKNRNLGNKVDGNLASLFQVFETRYNQRNQYDNFSVLTNRIPSKQYYVSVVPDYVNITYDVTILTNYVEQNNKIIEAIEYASDSYWGDANRWQFRTSLDSFGVTNIINTGEDRISSTTVSLKVYGYLIADSINQHLSNTNMHYSPAQIIFGLEVVGDVNENFNAASQVAASQVEGSTSFIGGGTNINNQIYTGLVSEDLAYISTNITKVANVVTTSTATFNSTSFLEPSVGSQLPPTSVSNFSFYVNGVAVTDDSITGFSSDGMGNIILIINVGVLGYTLVSTDDVVAIGKFA
jgi:hypothetical protein